MRPTWRTPRPARPSDQKTSSASLSRQLQVQTPTGRRSVTPGEIKKHQTHDAQRVARHFQLKGRSLKNKENTPSHRSTKAQFMSSYMGCDSCSIFSSACLPTTTKRCALIFLVNRSRCPVCDGLNLHPIATPRSDLGSQLCRGSVRHPSCMEDMALCVFDTTACVDTSVEISVHLGINLIRTLAVFGTAVLSVHRTSS